MLVNWFDVVCVGWLLIFEVCRLVIDLESEISCFWVENVNLKMEWEILKKVVVFFVREFK